MGKLNRIRVSTAAVAMACALALSACGGGPEEEALPEPSALLSEAGEALATATSQEEIEDATEDLLDTVEDMADSLEAQQSGGSAAATVGDQTWTFDGALCAFGEEEIGQEGAELVVSAITDGVQLYISIDSFGHNVDVNDIENFENPSVSLASAVDGEFIVVDGKDVSGEALFTDYETNESLEGTFEATCP